MTRFFDGLATLVGAVFLLGGTTKLAAAPMHLESFARWGLPTWFMVVVGLVEVVVAILMFTPRARLYGAVLAVATLLGAMANLIRAGELSSIAVPLVVLILSAFVGLRVRAETT